MTDPSIVRIERLDLKFAPQPWRFADDNRVAIDAHFAACQREKPELWNGRVLVLRDRTISDGILRGSYFETDFASFMTWRDWGFPPADATDCFACSALRGADGAFLVGVMGAHTANAGRVYFPSGTPDPDDVVGRRVDLDGSVRRELKEETGLDVEEFEAVPGWWAVIADPLLAMIKVLRAAEDAAALRARILANLARQRRPELADIRIVRGPADFDAMMPRYVSAYLTDVWAAAD